VIAVQQIIRRSMPLAACLLGALSCRAHQESLSTMLHSKTAVARETRLEKALTNPEAAVSEEPLAQWVLPAPLREISGLALTKDGYVLTHGDEIGEIWEVDYRRGILVKHFWLGDGTVKGDFEGITIANDVVFLMASNSKIYEFREGADGAHVPYKEYDPGLKKDCEFESIVYDPTINSLVLACKHIHDKDVHDALLLFRWSLTGDSTSRLTRLVVPIGDVLRARGWKNLHPSDITIDPFTGDYVLVASLEKALIEITPAGSVVFARPLPEGHQQAEGVAITKDSILLVSDEAKQGPAIITLYKWP
jgi:uncharacterized protein YjiK